LFDQAVRQPFGKGSFVVLAHRLGRLLFAEDQRQAMMLVVPRVRIAQGSQVLKFPEERRDLGESVKPEIFSGVTFKETLGPGDTHTIANLAISLHHFNSFSTKSRNSNS